MKNSARFGLRMYADHHPNLFYRLHRLKEPGRRLVVNQRTQLVIEGYPRSGNTFAVVAFEHAQQDVRIAHHLHSPAQVLLAVRWGIPALVLIRNPKDAALSLMIRHPEISADWALRWYISFYETLLGCHDDFVLAPFEEIVSDIGAIIDRINARFSTQFQSFQHTEENVKEVFARIEALTRAATGGRVVEERTARPSAERAELKSALAPKLEASTTRRALLNRAEAAYLGLLKGAGSHSS